MNSTLRYLRDMMLVGFLAMIIIWAFALVDQANSRPVSCTVGIPALEMMP